MEFLSSSRPEKVSLKRQLLKVDRDRWHGDEDDPAQVDVDPFEQVNHFGRVVPCLLTIDATRVNRSNS